jgi:hypothetical protein
MTLVSFQKVYIVFFSAVCNDAIVDIRAYRRNLVPMCGFVHPQDANH